MELKLLNAQGQAASNVAAADTIFGRDYNEALIHQVVIAYHITWWRKALRAKRASSFDSSWICAMPCFAT